MATSKRNWYVLLIGGASGVGKTIVSLRLARHYGLDLYRLGIRRNIDCINCSTKLER